MMIIFPRKEEANPSWLDWESSSNLQTWPRNFGVFFWKLKMDRWCWPQHRSMITHPWWSWLWFRVPSQQESKSQANTVAKLWDRVLVLNFTHSPQSNLRKKTSLTNTVAPLFLISLRKNLQKCRKKILIKEIRALQKISDSREIVWQACQLPLKYFVLLGPNLNQSWRRMRRRRMKQVRRRRLNSKWKSKERSYHRKSNSMCLKINWSQPPTPDIKKK